jgi:hypothetical protein
MKIYRIIILPFVLYGCETCAVARARNIGWMFENTVPRRIFGPKKDEVTWEWRKLLKEELYNVYSSPNIVRVLK